MHFNLTFLYIVKRKACFLAYRWTDGRPMGDVFSFKILVLLILINIILLGIANPDKPVSGLNKIIITQPKVSTLTAFFIK